MKILMIIVSFTLFILCASSLSNNERVNAHKPELSFSEVGAWVNMTGKWYGSQETRSGGLYEWTVTRTEDGLFRFEAKENGSEKYVEVDEWGIAGPIYFIIAKGWMDGETFIPVDPKDSNMDMLLVFK